MYESIYGAMRMYSNSYIFWNDFCTVELNKKSTSRYNTTVFKYNLNTEILLRYNCNNLFIFHMFLSGTRNKSKY